MSELAFTFAAMIRQQGTSGVRTFDADGITSSAALALRASSVKLQKVGDRAIGVFDVIAAIFAAIFIFTWLFVLLNDKLLSGWLLKRVLVARDALKKRDSWLSGLLRKLGYEEGASLKAPRLLEKPALIHYRSGWQLILDPDRKPMWAFRRNIEGFLHLPENERKRLTSLHRVLPLDGKSESGWYRLDPRRPSAPADAIAEWANDALGVRATTSRPRPEPPAPAVQPLGPWALYVSAKEEGATATQWIDTVTRVIEPELPEWEVTQLGWTRVRNLEDKDFYLHWPTMKAQWKVPLSEVRGAMCLEPPPPPPPEWFALWDGSREDARSRVLLWVLLKMDNPAAPPVRTELLAPDLHSEGDNLSDAWRAWQRQCRRLNVWEGNVTDGSWPDGVPITGGWYFTTATTPGTFYVPGPNKGEYKQQSRVAPPEVRAPPPHGAPHALPPLPAPFNDWFQVWDATSFRFWANVATGAASLMLPPGATTVAGGWRAAQACGAYERVGADGAVVELLADGRLPPREASGALHWLPAPSRWKPEPPGDRWRQLRTPPQIWGSLFGGGVGRDMWALETEWTTEGVRLLSGGLPVGVVSEGGWRLVEGVGGADAPLWVHPALRRVSRARPSADEEYEGLAARLAAETEGTFRGPTEEAAQQPPAAPMRPTLDGVWTLEGAAAARYVSGEAAPAPVHLLLPWVQEGTGARAALPPPGAKLPNGWKVVSEEEGFFKFVHAPSGRSQNDAPADAKRGGEPPTAVAPAAPPPALPAADGLWLRVREPSGLRVWAEYVSGARLPPHEGPPVGARLPGGWVVVAAGPAIKQWGVDKGCPRAFFKEATSTLREWDRVPEEADEEWQGRSGAWPTRGTGL